MCTSRYTWDLESMSPAKRKYRQPSSIFAIFCRCCCCVFPFRSSGWCVQLMFQMRTLLWTHLKWNIYIQCSCFMLLILLLLMCTLAAIVVFVLAFNSADYVSAVLGKTFHFNRALRCAYVFWNWIQSFNGITFQPFFPYILYMFASFILFVSSFSSFIIFVFIFTILFMLPYQIRHRNITFI